MMSQTSVIPLQPLGMVTAVFENLLGGRSLVFVLTEERQNQGVELGVLELPPHGTLPPIPLEHVQLGPEEMLPVVSGVGDDSSQTPHVSRGGDMTISSSENLRSEVTDRSVDLRGAVVHRTGGFP